MAIGLRGWETAFIKGVLCNWMVTLGAVLAVASRSTIGKVVAMWLPIMTFFAHGYEHSIVNMFLIPTGMLFGASVSLSQWGISHIGQLGFRGFAHRTRAVCHKRAEESPIHGDSFAG